jgi:hypothetical protein
MESNIKDPIGAKDILKRIKTNIVYYEDLKKYKRIEDLLYPYDSAILMYKSQPYYGHWVCIFKNKKGIEFFDSYGDKPDEEKKHISKSFLLESGQFNDMMLDLLIDAADRYNIFYNEHKIQDNKASTCGKHCILRLMMKELDTDEYYNFIKGMSKQYGISPDAIVNNYYNNIST